MAVVNTLKIKVEGKEFTVAGASFYEMLGQVKDIEGRRWDGDRKLWVLPLTQSEAKEVLSEYQILGDEDEVLDAEIAEIEKFQKMILENEAQIKVEIEGLEESVKTYSFRSKSSRKASMATDCACLRHALHSAKLPIEELAEIQIRGMGSACRIMGWL